MGRRFRVQEFDDIIVALMGASGWLSLLYFGRGNQVCVFAECVFVGGEGEKGGGSAYFGGGNQVCACVCVSLCVRGWVGCHLLYCMGLDVDLALACSVFSIFLPQTN